MSVLRSERIAFDVPGVATWVAEQTGVDCWLGPNHSVAFYRDGTLAGAAVYDSFTKHECCLHLAITAPPVPEFVLRAVFGYPFLQLGLRRVTALIRADNEAAIALARRNGFVEEGRKRFASGEVDEMIMGLLREDCAHIRDGLEYDPT